MALAEFEPQNHLEIAIVDGGEGAIPVEKVLEALLASPLTIASVTQVEPSRQGFEPLLLEDEGTPLVAAFSSLDRPRLHAEIAPHVVQIYPREFFLWIPPGYGVIVNPGYASQFIIDPAGVLDLQKTLQKPG